MQVADRVRVTKLDRSTDDDRSGFVGRDGTLVQRLNVAWTPDQGANWVVAFADGAKAVFAASELATIDAAGNETGSEIDGLSESWGDAPRTMSTPFRRMSLHSKGALAALVLVFAGLLLLGAGIAASSVALGGGGAAIVVIGLVAGIATMVS